jgi:hypothetical protein
MKKMVMGVAVLGILFTGLQADTTEVAKFGVEWGNMIWGNSVCLTLEKLIGKKFSFRLGYEYNKFHTYISAGKKSFLGFEYELEDSYDVTFWHSQLDIMAQYHVMRNKEIMGFNTLGIGWAFYGIRNENVMSVTDTLGTRDFKNTMYHGTSGFTFVVNLMEYAPVALPGLSFSLGMKGVVLNVTIPDSLQFNDKLGNVRWNSILENKGSDRYSTVYPEFYIRASYALRVDRGVKKPGRKAPPRPKPIPPGQPVPPPQPQPQPQPQPDPQPGPPPGQP